MIHRKASKKITTKISHKDYSKGEASPYWEALDEYTNRRGDKGNSGAVEYIECEEANPDMLAESMGIFYQDPEAKEDDRLIRIKKEWSKLTLQQRQVLQMVGYEGRTFAATAAVLGITVGSVQKVLERLRKRFSRNEQR